MCGDPALAQAPDVPVILRDGAVTGEIAAAGGVHEHLAGPGGAVAVVGDGPVPGGGVRLHVQQGHEPVLGGQVGPQRLQRCLVPQGGEGGGDEEVHQGLHRRALIVHPGLVALGAVLHLLVVQLNDVVAARAKGVDVVRPHQLGDLHVGPVQGAQGDRAVGHEFHVAGAAGLLGGQGDLLGDVAGGDEPLRPGDVVIFHHSHVEPGADLGVVLNEAAQAQNKVDDVLCHHIGRGGLGAENHGNGALGGLACLDLQVLVDDIQRVHLLALVFVQALDLDVEHRVGVQADAVLVPGEQVGGGALVGRLDVQQLFQHRAVVVIVHQAAEPGGVGAPFGAHALVQQGGQLGIAHLQPAPQGDAVGLVVELGGVDVIEMAQLGAL